MKDVVVTAPAGPQNAFDLFEQWTYAWPDVLAGDRNVPGRARLIKRMEGALGSFKGLDVLELGPHEGEVTCALEELGVRSILSIEGRTMNFLKCLVVKNHLKLKAKFLLGDFVGHLEGTEEQFGLIMASGVLYHLPDPLNLIRLMTKHTSRMAIDTLVYDRDKLEAATEAGAARWIIPENNESVRTLNDFSCTYYAHLYKRPREEEPYAFGGLSDDPQFMTSKDVIAAVEHFGFSVGWVEELDASNGPHLHLTATRR